MKNVDYQLSNLDLDDLGPSPEKLRTVPPIDGDSDTDFAAAPESGVDEEYTSPHPGAVNSQVKLNKGQRGVSKDVPAPSQASQGMVKKKLIEPRPFKCKLSSRNGSATAQKITAPSKSLSSKNGVSIKKINTSKKAVIQQRLPEKGSSLRKGSIPSAVVPEKASKADHNPVKKLLLTSVSQSAHSAARKSQNLSVPHPLSKQAEMKTEVTQATEKCSKHGTATLAEKHMSPDTAF